MSQRESRLSKKIQDKLKVTFGFELFVFKVWGSSHMMAGLPDLIGCYRGRFFAFEVKHPETRADVSARQALVHQFIDAAGGLCKVVCSPAEAIEALRALS